VHRANRKILEWIWVKEVHGTEKRNVAVNKNVGRENSVPTGGPQQREEHRWLFNVTRGQRGVGG